MNFHKLLFILVLFFSFIYCMYSSTFAFEINISNGNIKIKNDSGEDVYTSNLDQDKNVKKNGSAVSIGEVKNNGNNSSNIVKETKLENVTVIQDGKVTIYRSNTDEKGKGHE